jgi:hypothetical protein
MPMRIPQAEVELVSLSQFIAHEHTPPCGWRLLLIVAESISFASRLAHVFNLSRSLWRGRCIGRRKRYVVPIGRFHTEQIVDEIVVPIMLTP